MPKHAFRTTIIVIFFGLMFAGATACSDGGGKKKTKPYVIEFTALPAGTTYVNDMFSVEIHISDRKTGAPVFPSPALEISLAKAAGKGTLSGTLTFLVTGPDTIFSDLRYDGIGNLRLRASSPKSKPVVSPDLLFDAQIQVSPTDLGGVQPGDTIPSAVFSLTDGPAAPFPFDGDLIWTLEVQGSGAVQQSGRAAFGGTDMAMVILAPISVEDSYILKGHAEGSTTEASAPLIIASLIPQNLPGPFVALKSARIGQTYQDDVSFAVAGAFAWNLWQGALPPGIAIDPGTGILSGSPTTAGSYEFTLYGQTSGIDATPIRCALAVFSQDEREMIPAQSFVATGPHSVVLTDDPGFGFTSTFDLTAYTTELRIYHPDLATITTPLPMFVHHRGRGFHFLDYDDVLSHVASYGFICVSVEDYQSFYSPSAPSPISQYDNVRAELGMLSGSAFQEAALLHMIERSQTSGDPFEGKIDETRIVVGGHSRGGGSTHGSHVRGLDLKINGAIYFMPFDLRFFATVAPPAPAAPAYAIPTVQPRLPSLMIIAENDGDLIFPVADQIVERASGQATSVTVYGACHNYLGDTNAWEGWGDAPYITRQEQQDYIQNQVVAFLKRWTEMDISLEGFLYGNEFAGSSQVGVTALRNQVESVLVDDFQDGNPATNSLGGANSLTGGSRTEESFYPPLGWGEDFASLNIRNNRIVFGAVANATYSTAIPPATDTTGRERLIFRCAQTSLTGYDWVTFDVRLEDTAAQQGTVTLFNRISPSVTYLPDHIGGNRVYDRFVEVQVDLSQFQALGVDVTSLARIDFLFDFASPPSAAEVIYLDDIRFE